MLVWRAAVLLRPCARMERHLRAPLGGVALREEQQVALKLHPPPLELRLAQGGGRRCAWKQETDRAGQTRWERGGAAAPQ